MRRPLAIKLFVLTAGALVFLTGCNLADLIPGTGTIGDTIKSITVSFSVRGTALFTSQGNPTGENRDVGVATEIASTSFSLVEYDPVTHTFRAYANPNDKTVADMEVVFDETGTVLLSLYARQTKAAPIGWTTFYSVSGESFSAMSGDTLYGAEGTGLCSGYQLDVGYISTSNAGASVGQYQLLSHYCEASSYVRVTVER